MPVPTHFNQLFQHMAWADDQILQLLNHHGSYHRGQIAAAVRASGGDSVNTDK